MEKTESLMLLKGRFTPEEARDVLMNLFRSKIGFHEMRNFSSRERFGHDDQVAIERIPDLKESLRRIEELAGEAERTGRSLVLSSMVRIEFMDAMHEATPELDAGDA